MTTCKNLKDLKLKLKGKLCFILGYFKPQQTTASTIQHMPYSSGFQTGFHDILKIAK